MVITAMFQSAIIIPLVKLVYDSSRKYVAYRKRTIQHCESHAELRILICIPESDYVPTAINLLKASSPPQSHVGVYVMNLEEYIGRSMPVVIPHRLDKNPSSSKPAKIDPLLHAFFRYQQTNKAYVSVQCFTAVAPYASMHDDICSMAFQKATSLIIFPFLKTDPTLTKKVINNVLSMSPCSIGLLYDRSLAIDYRSFQCRRVCVLFIGGADDREALALGARMGRNPSIHLTVTRFVVTNPTMSDFIDEDRDQAMINDFRFVNLDSKNVEYVEEGVEEGFETLRIINAIANDFDLFLAGRRHEGCLHVLQGLGEWIEIEELGVVGDLLASDDFKSRASVLVIQQQAYAPYIE